MSWRNTDERYGRVAMLLHWSVALLFLGLYCSVYYRHWFTEKQTPENWTALQLHLSFGITVMVFVALRVAYKIWDRQPKDVPGSKIEHLAAHGAHLLLYAVMIIMPLTGYFGTGVNTEFFFLFDITQFKDTALYDALVTQAAGLSWEQFEPPIDFVHKKGGKYLVWVLILLHIAAAMYHHIIRKDNVLRRMLPMRLK